LKPQQVEVVEAALSKRDCLVVMPTGSGKSACFLLPGLIEHGVPIVISPLKSLMYNSEKNWADDVEISDWKKKPN
jgi:superfamily II DNA helicase RecQ